jgi:DNA-directed RNA polymerase specialized sigma24 family protein
MAPRSAHHHYDPPVHRALEQLPEEQRRLIALVYWSRLTRDEVAGQLNIPLAALEARTRTALAQLADVLESGRAVRPAH